MNGENAVYSAQVDSGPIKFTILPGSQFYLSAHAPKGNINHQLPLAEIQTPDSHTLQGWYLSTQSAFADLTEDELTAIPRLFLETKDDSIELKQ